MVYITDWAETMFKDYDRQDKTTCHRIRKCMHELKNNPEQPRGNTIKKLSGFKSLWRYRIGDNRLIYAVYPHRRIVKVLMFGPRKDIYDRLHYAPEAPDPKIIGLIEDIINPDAEPPENWDRYIRERKQETGHPLNVLLTRPTLEEWGVPEEYISLLKQCRTDEQLLACKVPGRYVEKIIDMMKPADRIEELAEQGTRRINNPEDLDKFANREMQLSDFLLALDEDQEKLVDWALKGPTLVKGGAGSGKSTVALYRVKTIIENEKQNHNKPRILFTTYTNALVNASKELLSHLIKSGDAELEVSTVDHIVKQIVSSVDGEPHLASQEQIKSALNGAIAAIQYQSENPFEKMLLKKKIDRLRDAYLREEIEWIIEGRGIITEEEYLKADRSGRGYRFDAKTRKHIWQVYEVFYRGLGRQQLTTWGELRKKALEYIRNGQWETRYDYVLVDEAQDLSPIALSLCLELCHSPSGLFLTADAGQSLYNRGFSWSKAHEQLKVQGRTRLLKRNYRTTRQIAESVNHILAQDKSAGDTEALQQFYVQVGPAPRYFEAPDEETMLYWVYERICTGRNELNAPLSTAAVICPNRSIAQNAATKLSKLGLPTKYMSSGDFNLEEDCVKAITIHTAKGLEFPIVAIPYAEQGIIPYSLWGKPEDVKEHLAHQRRLLYVGCTRAMKRLYVTYREGKRSTFLEGVTNWVQGELLI